MTIKVLVVVKIIIKIINKGFCTLITLYSDSIFILFSCLF